jgi:hypothetical protein
VREDSISLSTGPLGFMGAVRAIIPVVEREFLQLSPGRPFKELVNAALRAGLDRLEEGEGKPEPYAIGPVEGSPRRIDLDNVAELVAETEGNHYR